MNIGRSNSRTNEKQKKSGELKNIITGSRYVSSSNRLQHVGNKFISILNVNKFVFTVYLLCISALNQCLRKPLC